MHSVLRPAREGLMELLAEFFKRAKRNSLSNPAHRVKVKVEVMQRVKGSRAHFAGDEKVAKVRARKVPARVAAALGIGRGEVLRVARVFDDQRPMPGQQ